MSTPSSEKETTKKSIMASDCACLLDFSFFKIVDPADLEGEEPRCQNGKKIPKQLVKEVNEDGEEVEVEKFVANALRLANNNICDHGALMKVMTKIVVDPHCITWIDLSTNQLNKIDPILLEFEMLQMLYLQNNAISDPSEVDKLAKLPRLKKLALHCNPISSIKDYRSMVLAVIPQLINFDMSGVTKSDRATAAGYRASNKNTKKKKAKSQE